MAELDFIEGDLPDALDFQEGPIPEEHRNALGESKEDLLRKMRIARRGGTLGNIGTGLISGLEQTAQIAKNPIGALARTISIPLNYASQSVGGPQIASEFTGANFKGALETPLEMAERSLQLPPGQLTAEYSPVTGVTRSVEETASDLSNPETATLIPLFGPEAGAVSPTLSTIGKTLITADILKNLPEQARRTSEVLSDPNASAADKFQALTGYGTAAGFASTIGSQIPHVPEKPNVPSYTGKALEIPKGAEPTIEKGPENAISERISKALSLEEPPGNSQEVGARVPGTEEPANAQGATEASGNPPPQQGEAAGSKISISEPVSRFADQMGDMNSPINNKQSSEAGLGARTIDDLNALAELRDKSVASKDELLNAVKSDPSKMQQAMTQSLRVQLPREAIEVATNTGGWEEGKGAVPLGQRPLDWHDNPIVQDWLRNNAERLKINLPEDFPTKPVEQPTYSERATEFANRIREQFKTPDVTLSSFGVIPKIIDAAVEIVAKTIEAGGAFADAAAKGIDYIKKNHKGDFDESAFRAKLNTIYNGDKAITGIAQRVREQVAQSGHEELSPRGTGIDAEASVNRGNELLKNGADPERVMADFESTGRVSGDDIAVARAKLTQLSTDARDLEKTRGVESPQYKAAFKARSDWAARVKKMQTEWHKIGQAQQGEVNVDTGTFTGLQGMYHDATGKEFTPKQIKQAQEKAQAIQKSRDAADKSEGDLVREFDQKTNNRTDAEQRALDAAHKTVREAAVRKAKAETRERIADVKIKQATEDLQKSSEQRALDAANKVTKRAAVDTAKAEIKKRLDAAQREKEIAKVAQVAEQRALDRANKTVREAAILAAKRAQEIRADPLKHVWDTARKYMDRGIFKFDDIVDRVATELGMKREKVIELLNQTDRIRAMTNDLLTKRQNVRRLDAQAKRWVERQTQPALQNIAETASRGLFNVRVFGHGPTALGTHAPMIAFQPKFWGDYAKAFVSNFKFMKDPAYYEMKVQDLVREPNYPVANDAGLVVDPFQYEDLNNPKVAVALGKWTGAGARGYTALKFLRMDMFNKYWDELPNHMKTKEMAQGIADSVNHATGVTKAGAPKGTAMALFAPRLLASKAAWLGADPARTVGTFANWKNATPEQKAFAIRTVKERAWVMGVLGSLLALNQGFNKAIGSKQNVNVTDPTKSDWLKFKVGGMNVGWGTGLINMARLPARLWSIRESDSKRVVPDERSYNALGEFARTQESPILSLGTDLWFRSDYQDRPLPNSNKRVPKYLRNQGVGPYTWPEWITRQVLPIPAEEAAKEVWQHGFGMSKEQQKAYLRAMAKISFTTLGGRLSDDYDMESDAAEPMFKSR